MLRHEGVEASKKEGPKFMQRLVAKQKTRVKGSLPGQAGAYASCQQSISAHDYSIAFRDFRLGVTDARGRIQAGFSTRKRMEEVRPKRAFVDFRPSRKIAGRIDGRHRVTAKKAFRAATPSR
jgi:hypothetical protein